MSSPHPFPAGSTTPASCLSVANNPRNSISPAKRRLEFSTQAPVARFSNTRSHSRELGPCHFCTKTVHSSDEGAATCANPYCGKTSSGSVPTASSASVICGSCCAAQHSYFTERSVSFREVFGDTDDQLWYCLDCCVHDAGHCDDGSNVGLCCCSFLRRGQSCALHADSGRSSHLHCAIYRRKSLSAKRAKGGLVPPSSRLSARALSVPCATRPDRFRFRTWKHEDEAGLLMHFSSASRSPPQPFLQRQSSANVLAASLASQHLGHQRRTCHFCGKDARTTKRFCSNVYCDKQSGQAQYLCDSCCSKQERYFEAMDIDWRAVFGNPESADWTCLECSKCVDFAPMHMGVCCCSFRRNGFKCPLHLVEMPGRRIHCHSYYQNLPKIQDKLRDVGELFDVHKLRTLSPGERSTYARFVQKTVGGDDGEDNSNNVQTTPSFGPAAPPHEVHNHRHNRDLPPSVASVRVLGASEWRPFGRDESDPDSSSSSSSDDDDVDDQQDTSPRFVHQYRPLPRARIRAEQRPVQLGAFVAALCAPDVSALAGSKEVVRLQQYARRVHAPLPDRCVLAQMTLADYAEYVYRLRPSVLHISGGHLVDSLRSDLALFSAPDGLWMPLRTAPTMQEALAIFLSLAEGEQSRARDVLAMLQAGHFRHLPLAVSEVLQMRREDGAHQPIVQLVVLNACCGGMLANQLVHCGVRYAVCWLTATDAEAREVFSTAFYESLGSGTHVSVEYAFSVARAALAARGMTEGDPLSVPGAVGIPYLAVNASFVGSSTNE